GRAPGSAFDRSRETARPMTSFGRPRHHFRVTDSTNERARELALAGAPGGTVATADKQTSGRGRRGRGWAAPSGKALLYSAIVRPLGREHGLLPLAVPLAVCEAVEALAVLEEFAERDALRGREIRWEGAGSAVPSGAGRAEGIDDKGNLLVATEDGQYLSLGAGEVQLALRAAG